MLSQEKRKEKNLAERLDDYLHLYKKLHSPRNIIRIKSQ
jgi:hypothetical protein